MCVGGGALITGTYSYLLTYLLKQTARAPSLQRGWLENECRSADAHSRVHAWCMAHMWQHACIALRHIVAGGSRAAGIVGIGQMQQVGAGGLRRPRAIEVQGLQNHGCTSRCGKCVCY